MVHVFKLSSMSITALKRKNDHFSIHLNVTIVTRAVENSDIR